MYFFSPGTKGFYVSGINTIPEDAVSITNEEHAALLAAQGQGAIITPDAQGRPEAVYPGPKTLAETISEKLLLLGAHRFEKETGGITINGAEILTDRESQALITGAWVKVQMDENALIDWKGANGWVQIGKTAVEAVAAAVGNHVQACFTNERTHAEAIEALTTIEAVEAYDFTVGW